ncbi:hypothetical protein FNF27_02399 [Cafeteria roenbergensis]|uniref:C3H1-type domain-containing protein n=1 Tax=Cafeteria roenbergensis TaxID=33653 RepID=A0A5A8C6T2_CAFRO|nr:hypothetical protein FNF29_07306 [Cafeteria roenbergensis]KAA0167506.1 hypothetical protein FNF31_00945 [Cafeteria roenbergensis]KAA0172420.1 hypothetical protein FNF28_00103 [Cafeteria roenbergensis]KAA0176007.1 hypothetical protein FNF27_02399 [Cafeteria roenbergensis]|eukprot:KAA0147561.1 hypothetical protein FNF29_07306 [Cafeteria roenbergensis]
MGARSGRSGRSGGGQHALFKTEMCRTFTQTGACRYGEKCQFAHGLVELRPVARHPKHKTERCRSFWVEGRCEYGARCRFLHDEPAIPDDAMLADMPRSMAHDPMAHVSPLISQMLAAGGGLAPELRPKYFTLVPMASPDRP